MLVIEAAPDAELVGVDRVLDAVEADWMSSADLPGPDAGVTVRREEEVRVLTEADCPVGPRAEDDFGHDDWKYADGRAAAGDAVGHEGSLHASRDGGAVSLG